MMAKTMAQPQGGKSLTIINPAPAFAVTAGFGGEILATDIAVESLKASVKELVSECQEIFRDVANTNGNPRLCYVDLCLGISVDGSIGVFGTQPGTEGGIKLRLEFARA
jgi:hypothetical protein